MVVAMFTPRESHIPRNLIWRWRRKTPKHESFVDKCVEVPPSNDVNTVHTTPMSPCSHLAAGSVVDVMHRYLEHKSIAHVIKLSSNIYIIAHILI